MNGLKVEAASSKLAVEEIARVCHEANRAYCRVIGDITQLGWLQAPEWQKQSAVDGVRYRLENPGATSKDMHANWMALKRAEGWSYGQIKREDKKQHPCMVEYEELPLEQRRKDDLFSAIVVALTGE